MRICTVALCFLVIHHESIFVKKPWLRKLTLPGDHVLKNDLQKLAELADTGHCSFAQKVKLVLPYYGLDINRMIESTNRESKRLELSFRENLFARHMKECSQNHTFPLNYLHTRKLKRSTQLSPTLFIFPIEGCPPPKQAVARLLVSSHNINIEKGRHSRPRISRYQRYLHVLS